MASSAMAPAPGSLQSGESEQRGQQPRPRIRLSQLVCVAILVLSDLSAIAIALELAIIERTQLMSRLIGRSQLSTLPFRHYMELGWLWLLMIVFIGVEGLYTKRRSSWNEIGYLTKAIGVGFVAILASVTLARRGPDVSRETLVLMAANLLILLPITRFWTKRILGKIGLWRKSILIVGASKTAEVALRELTSDPFLGYEVVGMLDDDPARRGECVGVCKGKPISILGNLSELREQVERTQAKDVLIAMPELSEMKLLALVHKVQLYCDSIYVVPALWGLPMMNLQVDGFLHARLMMLKLSNNLAKPWNTWLKRILDLIMGMAIALFAFPLGVLLAVFIRTDSEGPALFAQERLGRRGANFPCLKFRTMHVKSDEMLVQYLQDNPKAADEWQKYAKLRDFDPRVTRLGRFLRQTSLDELPQLWNVLKGDMSLVGPRPYLPRESARIGVELPTILSARPGMTGLWQVSGRNQMTFEDRVRIEAWYLRNWSIWLDCIILAKTVKIVLLPRNREAVVNVAEVDADAGDSSLQVPQRTYGKSAANNSITAAKFEER
jgi:Undecaprenyl-phosphate galactose phosphotransferase WbaP